MVKGGLKATITTNINSHKILKSDPILSKKEILLIKSIEDLPESVEKLFSQKFIKKRRPVFVGVGAVVTRKGKVLLIRETTDSPFYLRKKGMWGFPTTTLHNDAPEKQSLFSLKKETNIIGSNPKFICSQSIPNAVGLFYKLNVKKISQLKNAKWFDYKDVLSENIYLRPTYSNVLKKYLNDN